MDDRHDKYEENKGSSLMNNKANGTGIATSFSLGSLRKSWIKGISSPSTKR